jgi:drug/metabolite transporter (DMT)-like permease
MEEKQTEYKLSMATLNGIILAVIGILVLITPMTTNQIPASQLFEVYVAGAFLTIGGLVTMAFGFARRKQHAEIPSEPGSDARTSAEITLEDNARETQSQMDLEKTRGS